MGERSLVIQSVRKESDGEYSCGAVNSEGEGLSDPLFLRIQCKFYLLKFVSRWTWWAKQMLRYKEVTSKLYLDSLTVALVS